MVHPQIRDEVPHKHVVEAIGPAEDGEHRDGGGQSEVTEEDEAGILGLVERAEVTEVVDAGEVSILLALATALKLALVLVVSGGIGEEVHGPADELLADGVDEGRNWGLLGELVELVDGAADARGEFLTGLGHEDHVALHVAGGLVVLAVGDLPGEVGDEEGGVADEARGVVQDLGGREGLVAALVGQNPETGAKEALDDGVETPEGRARRGPGDVLGSDEVVGEGKGEAETGDIPEDVGEAAQARALEAVLGDGIADVVDREVGQLELVAVGVEQGAIGLLGLGVVDRGHGREGRGRGRLAGGVAGGALGGGGGRVGHGGGGGGATQDGALGEGRGSHCGGGDDGDGGGGRESPIEAEGRRLLGGEKVAVEMKGRR